MSTILSARGLRHPVLCCNGGMALLEELRDLLERCARPDGTTPVDGVLVSRLDGQDAPGPSMSGTVVAVVA